MKTSVLFYLLLYIASIGLASGAPVDDNLREAIATGNITMAETALKSGADIEVSENGNTPLTLALGKGDGAMAELLIKRGARSNGVTPLMIATLKGDLEALKTLVKVKKDLNAVDTWAENALHYAVRAKDMKVIELLLKNGINVNQRGAFRLTPLMVAVESGSSQIIELLVKYKSEVNAQDIYGQTPLYIATCKGNLEAIVTLLSHRANVNILDKEDNSALSIARSNMEAYLTRDDQESKTSAITYTAIVKVLRKAGAIESGELSAAN